MAQLMISLIIISGWPNRVILYLISLLSISHAFNRFSCRRFFSVVICFARFLFCTCLNICDPTPQNEALLEKLRSALRAEM